MNWIEIAAIAMFFLSFYGLVTSRKMIKSVVCMAMLQSAVILFYLSIGYQSGATPPIGDYFSDFERVADPLPQALMITAIVIGVAIITISITMLMALFRNYGTSDWDKARKKSME